jgi:adenosyl cobinamide kinase/adenosyl cobinamide phosphate guanylyltransferase
MILVIGGSGSGKRGYVRGLGVSDSMMSDGIMDSKPVLLNLHKIVFANPSNADAIYYDLIRKDVVTCNEVGSGIIPINPQERQARDACGRLCCRLAQAADQVVRMVCGVPVTIKQNPRLHNRADP